MTNPNVLYSVTGRYMAGQKLVAYHLVGEDGSQAQETKDRVIYLIRNGIITNMRLQIAEDGDTIIRGKGVNLNNLPVFDIKKQKFRDDDISQSVANSGVNVSKRVDSANRMGQYTILRRIMYKTTCMGYEVQSYNGDIYRKKKEQVVELAVQRLISNAIAQKTVDMKTGKIKIGLRGVNCELKKLPILIVSKQGKIVDPKADKSVLTIRGAYLKRAGVIRELNSGKQKAFKHGEFLVCYPDGSLDITSKDYLVKYYKQDTERDNATCDDYLDDVNNYSIEIFGANPIVVNPNLVKSWMILKPIGA